MRRAKTEKRKKLHKNTHNWTRKRYRQLIRDGIKRGYTRTA